MMSAATVYLAEIEYEINETECTIAVTDYEPLQRGTFSGPPEKCWTDEGGFGEYHILVNGKRDPLLDAKITPAIDADIQSRIFAEMER